ncbi:phage tail assembly chaperone [Aquibium microcysteis]|uniref:phage tail assembly chaperone n=1 Tax=Aquibium microcysteis TaxID=675281 RepID=UPI00165D2A7D|nr:phage tail assembly chaperone [Aquibium microcysteis]
MRLAYQPITIAIDGATATLRPSLRAACLLEQKHGIAVVIKAVDEGNLGIVADLVAFTGDNDTLANLLREIDQAGVVRLNVIKPALFNVLAVMIGYDDSDQSTTGTGSPLSFAEFFEQLFEIATGWLGWTPAQAWAATPAEIMAAQRGLIAKLKAIHGTAEAPAKEYDPNDLPTPEEVRAGIEVLRAQAQRGKR